MEPKLPPFHRIVAYLRKSRADGEESVEAVLARHERMIQDYCLRNYNAELPADRIYREVQSAETIAARPVMQRIIRMIQDREIDAVLCVDLQRLSRGDLSEVGELSTLFRYTGCLIITPVRTYNVSDEYDRKFFEMEIMHGNDYLEYIKKIMGRGRRQSVMEGNYIYSGDPYGYRRVYVDKRPTLEIHEEEAAVVRMIYDLYTGADHVGPAQIARRLNNLGVKPRKLDKWTSDAVTGILRNPLYIAKITWQRQKEIREYSDGKIVIRRRLSKDGDYIIADARHPAIITQEIYDKAQEIRSSRGHPAVKSRNDLINPLAGLVKCGVCGRSMTHRNGERDPKPMILCASLDCPTRAAYTNRILDQLRESMQFTLDEYRRKIENNDSDSTENPTRAIYEKELAELRKQQKRQFELLERGIYTEEIFLERSTEVNERIAAITSELSQLDANKKTENDYAAFCTSLQRCIDVVCDDSVSAKEKNALLKGVIKSITYNRAKSTRGRWEDTPIFLQIFYKI